MNLGRSPVHTSDELGSFSIPTTIIVRTTNASNWIPPKHILGEGTAAIMSRTRSEQNYSSKTDFETGSENLDFEVQNIPISRPPLDSTPFLQTRLTENINNWLDYCCGKKSKVYATNTTDRFLTLPTYLLVKWKGAPTREPGSIPIIVRLTIKNLIRRMIAIAVNQLKRNTIKRIFFRNTGNRTRQTHRQVILIRPTPVTTDANNVKRRAVEKSIR